MDENNENISKEMKNTRNNQIETKELQNTVTELKNILEDFNSTLDDAKEWISEHKNKEMELTQWEANRKKNEKSEDSLMVLWDTIKLTNIQFIELPGGK